MKPKIKWYRKISLRRLKKQGKLIWESGVGFRFWEYDKLVNQFMNFKIGDKVYNHYINNYDYVSQVITEWEEYNNCYILVLNIITETGYILRFKDIDAYPVDQIPSNYLEKGETHGSSNDPSL